MKRVRVYQQIRSKDNLRLAIQEVCSSRRRNGDHSLNKKVLEIEAHLDDYVEKLDQFIQDLVSGDAHFNNELLRPIKHTKEEFVEVLAKIDEYERYCEEHPEYPNNRAILAIENIREVYKEHLKKRDFLQESCVQDADE